MDTAPGPNVIIDEEKPKPESLEIIIYEHTPLLYWWPVWVLGFVMYFLTVMEGETIIIGNWEQKIYPGKDLGVIYCLVLFLVIIMTNVVLRGLVSGIVIMAVLFIALLLAYLRLWDDILEALGHVAIFATGGFYLYFSTALCITWVFSVFVFDRLNYWKFRPGQAAHFMFFGGGAKTYDTRGMTVYKLRSDIFRHWILGLGSGDLRIAITGASQQEVELRNVLFVGSKVKKIQYVVAIKPDELADIVTAGEAH